MADLICSLQLEDLNKGGSCENKMSGVKTVYFALKDDIKTFPTLPSTRNAYEDYVQLTGALTMKDGKRFFKLHSERDLGELKYETQGVTGGKSFKGTLEIQHSGFKHKILGFLAATINEELIILCKLNNGEIHMLGDADRGAEYGDGTTTTSGKAVTDQNGVTLNFSYDTPAPLIYTGDIETLLVASTTGGV